MRMCQNDASSFLLLYLIRYKIWLCCISLIRADNDLKHHFAMIRTSTNFLVAFLEVFKIKTIHDCIYNTYKIIFCNISSIHCGESTVWLGM